MELIMNQKDLIRVYEEFISNVYSRDPLSYQHDRALRLIATLNENIRDLKRKLDEIEAKYNIAVTKASHWDIIKAAIEKNPMLKEE